MAAMALTHFILFGWLESLESLLGFVFDRLQSLWQLPCSQALTPFGRRRGHLEAWFEFKTEGHLRCVDLSWLHVVLYEYARRTCRT